jgi:hypothetical protein
MPGTMKCLRTRENVILKTEKLLLTWISYQDAKVDSVNSKLIRKKANRLFGNSRSVFISVYLPKTEFNAQVHDFA